MNRLKMNDFFSNCLICPICGEQLSELDDNTLECDSGHLFPQADGVPVLRGESDCEQLTPRGGDGFDPAEVIDSASWIGKIRRIIGTNYVPYPIPSSNYIDPDSRVLNLGSGMQEHFNQLTVNLDCFLYPRVDLVASAGRIPFQDCTFDVVVAEFMLEHVPDPHETCREILRVLRPGGILYLSWPLHHSYHSFPEDYYRFTEAGISAMLDGAELIDRGVLSGPACHWLGATADLIACLFGAKGHLKTFLRLFTLALLFPVKYLDILCNRRTGAEGLAVTLFGVFRKPSRSKE